MLPYSMFSAWEWIVVGASTHSLFISNLFIFDRNNSGKKTMLFEKILQWSFFGAVYLFFKTACRGEVAGNENIESCLASGFVLVANHASYLDSIVIWCYLHYKYDVDIIFFAKDKLFNNALFGPCMRALSYVKVSDTGDAVLDKKTYKNMLRGKTSGSSRKGAGQIPER